MIITIDGAAGTGKSTVAKKVAELLKIAYFDTGAMYRAFAYHIQHDGIDPHNLEKVKKSIVHFHFTFEGLGTHKTYFVNGVDITHELRSPSVTELSSIISQYPFVRSALHRVQKEFAATHSAVFEGRDLGTVIFPEAKFKFFLKASDEIRAARRYKEMTHKGVVTTLAEVLSAIQERDKRDQERAVAPLKCASDAHVIDTSFKEASEVAASIVEQIQEAL